MKHDTTKPYESKISRHDRLFAPGQVPFVPRVGYRRRKGINRFEFAVLVAFWVMLIGFGLLALWTVPGCTALSSTPSNTHPTTQPSTQPSNFDTAIHNGISGSQQGADVGTTIGAFFGAAALGGLAGRFAGFLVGTVGTLLGFKPETGQRSLTVVHTVSDDVAKYLPLAAPILASTVPAAAGPAAVVEKVAQAVSDATAVPVK